AMGMRPALEARWRDQMNTADAATLVAGDGNTLITSAIKAFRLFLQSAMLGLGAYLAILQEITPGVMIAASIILGRALAPLEQAVGQWRSVVKTRDAWARLNATLGETPAPAARMSLPAAVGALSVESLFAGPPGERKATVGPVSFELEPGEALGVIGPSASGKSTLARALIGVWTPLGGCVRLDGADLRDWSPAELGPQVGYLPQEVELFSGTVRENIARLQPDADPERIVAAALSAGCHEMILRLPDGYDAEIGPGGAHLSSGQRQRIALARAMYGDPKLIVLDEPNANLDAAGDEALADAILYAKDVGSTVVVVSHRPAGVRHVDKLLVLRAGGVRAFGPRDDVLRSLRERPAAAAPPAAGRAERA
ncbi:MAG: ATP-binding cassette domain-containing protein, partial [Pseudomonadota bacterium]